MIDIKDTLLLDDGNEYVVISKAKFDTLEYYYLLDKKNSNNFKFCYLKNEELIEVEDERIIKMLIPIFLENAEDVLNELMK